MVHVWKRLSHGCGIPLFSTTDMFQTQRVAQISLRGARVATRARAEECWRYERGWGGKAKAEEACGVQSLVPKRNEDEEGVVLGAER